ncbi:MAG: hypothetical protein ACLGHN_15160 [Bacteriovoracia bacterium]
MNTFAPPKKKLIELIIMLPLAGVYYLLYPEVDAIVLFLFGFIWNWSASNELSNLFSNKRYRMSLLRTVVNLQSLILRPFSKAPGWIKKILNVLPAGIFWGMVVYINDSHMPWWSTFIGSAAFELMQLELKFIRKQKDEVPEIPKELP